jgi:hypothetical protein
MQINSTDNTVHKNINMNVRGSILYTGSPASHPGTLKYTSLEAYFSDDAILNINEKPRASKTSEQALN